MPPPPPPSLLTNKAPVTEQQALRTARKAQAPSVPSEPPTSCKKPKGVPPPPPSQGVPPPPPPLQGVPPPPPLQEVPSPPMLSSVTQNNVLESNNTGANIPSSLAMLLKQSSSERLEFEDLPPPPPPLTDSMVPNMAINEEYFEDLPPPPPDDFLPEEPPPDYDIDSPLPPPPGENNEDYYVNLPFGSQSQGKTIILLNVSHNCLISFAI